MKKKILLCLLVIMIEAITISGSILLYDHFAHHYVRLFVAAHQLNQRQKIDETDLQEIRISKDSLSPEMIIPKEDLIGKYIRLSFTVPKGSFFYRSVLEDQAAISDFADTLLKAGEVSYDLFLDDLKINLSHLKADKRVDIYLTIRDGDMIYSDLLLRHARILAIYDEEGREISSFDDERQAKIATLAVKEKEAIILNKALAKGEISILASSESFAERDSELNDSVLLEVLG